MCFVPWGERDQAARLIRVNSDSASGPAVGEKSSSSSPTWPLRITIFLRRTRALAARSSLAMLANSSRAPENSPGNRDSNDEYHRASTVKLRARTQWARHDRRARRRGVLYRGRAHWPSMRERLEGRGGLRISWCVNSRSTCDAALSKKAKAPRCNRPSIDVARLRGAVSVRAPRAAAFWHGCTRLCAVKTAARQSPPPQTT